MTPQIIAPDLLGLNNRNFEASLERLDYTGAYKDLSTIIIVPAFGSVPTKCVASWLSLITPPNGKVFRMWPIGFEVGHAYSQAIESILAHPELSKFKYMLHLEADNSPPPDGLIRLLAQMEKHPEFSAISGLYWTKGMPDEKTGGGQPQLWGDPRAADQPNFRPQKPVAGQLIEVNGTGQGFTLFRLEMFKDERLRKPWFQTKCDVNGVGTQDLQFFADAKLYGYRFAVDCDVLVGHYDLSGAYGPPDTMY